MIRKMLFIGLCCGLLSSCYYDVEEELYGSIICDIPETVSFSQDVSQIINFNCATSGCHSASGTAPGNFDSYDGVIPSINDGSFQSAVIINKVMPPWGALEECKIQIIEKWINEGANNN